jgi:hypothetical protein
MDIVDDAEAVDVDPLSAFPSESELEQRRVHDQKNQTAPDGTSSEIITALFSALYDLQIELHSLKAELTETKALSRGAHQHAEMAIAAVSGVKSRVSSIEGRHTVRGSTFAIATRARQILHDDRFARLYDEIRSRSSRWLRRLLTATSVVLKANRVRR